MDRQALTTKIISVAALVALGSLALFIFFSTRPANNLKYGPITNIDGIPFPSQDNNLYITEKLAHTDIYLRHNILARQLIATLTFIPYQTQTIALGVRHTSFWLSYNKIPIYHQTNNTDVTSPRTVTVTIPLTDKWPDKDGSVDLMIFSTMPNSGPTEDDGVADQTDWLLQDIQFSSRFAPPTYFDFTRYVKRSLTQLPFL